MNLKKIGPKITLLSFFFFFLFLDISSVLVKAHINPPKNKTGVHFMGRLLESLRGNLIHGGVNFMDFCWKILFEKLSRDASQVCMVCHLLLLVERKRHRTGKGGTNL